MLAFVITAFIVASSKRFSNGSVVKFGCSSSSLTPAIPSCYCASASPVAVAAGSSVRCLLRSVASVLWSRGAVREKIWTSAALVMPLLLFASLLVRCRRASGVSSPASGRLLPANTTNQSIDQLVLFLGTLCNVPAGYTVYLMC